MLKLFAVVFLVAHLQTVEPPQTKPSPCYIPSDTCQIAEPPSLMKPMAYIPIANK